MDFSPELQAAFYAFLIVAARQILEMVGKKIPDNATGINGMIRKLAKLVSGYISNEK